MSDLPDRLNLRHSKLEAKRRLAAGEFTTLHDAQLAVAREHGMSSWAALKQHIAAEIGLGWLLHRPMDFAGHNGGGAGSSASLITHSGTGRTSVVLTNRLVPVEPVNVGLIRSAGS